MDSKNVLIILNDDYLLSSFKDHIDDHCRENGFNIKCFVAGLTVLENDLLEISNNLQTPFDEIVQKVIDLSIKVKSPSNDTFDFKKLSEFKLSNKQILHDDLNVIEAFEKPKTIKHHKEKKQRYRNYARKHNF